MPGTFGAVGTYEKISGTFIGEVDPKDARNAIIQDLQLAPLNANGTWATTGSNVRSVSRRSALAARRRAS